MGEDRKVYRVLVGKPQGKRRLGRPSRRWEDGIRMDIREIGLGSVEWIQLAQDRDRWRALVNMAINHQFLQMTENFLASWRSVCFSERTATW
jgi:hypothetical protein